jgi:hypothetical protein
MLKESAPRCSLCGRLLWVPWYDKRRDSQGRLEGRNPGIRRNNKWVCYMTSGCSKRQIANNRAAKAIIDFQREDEIEMEGG